MARTKYEDDNPEISIDILGSLYVVNEETGEILEWPAGEARSMDRIVQLAIAADQSAKAWRTAADGFKAMIAGLMRGTGVDRVKASTGSASIQERAGERVPGGPAFVQWLRDIEFPPEEYPTLLAIAQEFSVSGFREVCGELDIPTEAMEKAMSFRPYRFTKLTPARPAPPEVRRGPAREE